MNQNDNNQDNQRPRDPPNNPQLVVHSSGEVYSDGTHLGQLFMRGRDDGDDAFDHLRFIFESYFHEKPERPWYHPVEANAEPHIPWRQPEANDDPPEFPTIVVRASGDVYSGGTHLGQIFADDDDSPDAFHQLRTIFESYFHERADRPWYHPVYANAAPPIPWRQPAAANLNLQLRPENPAEDHGAILALQDQQFEALQDLDLHRRIGYRVAYLNRLLVQKLDLDFTEAWSEFQRRSTLQFLPPSPEYCQAVDDRLQSACTRFYNAYHVNLADQIANQVWPIDFPREIHFQVNIFNNTHHTYEHWFNLRTQHED